MVLTAIHIATLLCAAAVFVAIAVSDVRSYRIPNVLCGALLALFPVFVLSAPQALHWQHNVIVFCFMSIAGVALFSAKLVGAGDIKLLAVASLWAGVALIPKLLLITAIAGGVESLVMVWIAMRTRQGEDAGGWRKIKIPYGVAISAGGLAVLFSIAKPFLLSV